MEKKIKRLAIVGIVVFAIVLALIVLMLPEPKNPVPENLSLVVPYFFESGSGTANLLNASIDSEKTTVKVSSEGFPYNQLVLEPKGSAFYHSLVLENDSPNIMSFVVTSQKKDGEIYAIKRFVVAAGENYELRMFVPGDLDEIISSEAVLVKRTDKGVPLFEVSCTANCNQEKNYISIYG